ncbi:MAG: hypothetical protein KJO01_02815 [Gammaproteobacteria bacterium]|nr:hypothetical protein [Gammaproteobacteria bacterium]MBT8110109.1 hypothetical protein [Gammaproteobacteria bacterium]NNL44813.1 hypothetical protein [Woeseiaceae bacterium]
MIRRILILLTVLVAQAIPAVAQSREKDLDRWLDRDLIPYVRQQLIVHPRFKNETVMFVVLRDNAPASASNALALSLRDRILAAAVATPGVAIGWQQGRSGNSLDSQPQDCTLDDVHYYIGIELTQKLDGSYSVNVRALDLEDRNWVTGFGKHWKGQLSTTQRQAMRQSRIDETFLGARDVPFTLAQTDLLAAHLAHQLTCTMQKRVSDEYVVAADLQEPTASGLHGTVELISNNLANRQALILSNDETRTNAVLSGKAHQIDGVLFQYWLTVTPQNEDDDVTALSASAYIVLPATQSAHLANSKTSPATTQAATVMPASISIPNAGKDSLINSLQLSSPASLSECKGGGVAIREATYMTGVRPCSMLQTRANADSIVFFLEHQANHGLVRLAGSECRDRTKANIVRSGELLSFPIAKTTTARQNWSETYEWLLQPDLDTYYAVVVSDASLARRVANHMDNLPLRCSASIRPGLEGDDLREWLSDFAMITARSSKYVDWRAVRVKDVL